MSNMFSNSNNQVKSSNSNMFSNSNNQVKSSNSNMSNMFILNFNSIPNQVKPAIIIDD
jgi:hypothetical protein